MDIQAAQLEIAILTLSAVMKRVQTNQSSEVFCLLAGSRSAKRIIQVSSRSFMTCRRSFGRALFYVLYLQTVKSRPMDHSRPDLFTCTSLWPVLLAEDLWIFELDDAKVGKKQSSKRGLVRQFPQRSSIFCWKFPSSHESCDLSFGSAQIHSATTRSVPQAPHYINLASSRMSVRVLGSTGSSAICSTLGGHVL